MTTSNQSKLSAATPLPKTDEHFIENKIFFICFILGSFRIYVLKLPNTVDTFGGEWEPSVITWF